MDQLHNTCASTAVSVIAVAGKTAAADLWDIERLTALYLECGDDWSSYMVTMLSAWWLT